MAENQDGQEKKHAATGRKKKDAAEKGQIAKSQDLGSLGVLAGGAVATILGGPYIAEPLMDFSIDLWDFRENTFTMADLSALTHQAIVSIGLALSLPLSGASIGAIITGIMQSQFQFAPKALEPKIEKLNPIQGFKQSYLSWTPLVELGKGLAKLIIIGGIVAWGVWDRVDTLPELAAVNLHAFLLLLVELVTTMLLFAFPAVIAIAAADYAYSAWKTADDLKMTDEELKQQTKDQDGDPKWKGMRRGRARQIAMGTLVQALREADVIVTNPTHFAVALRYQRAVDPAPIVLAKGVDHRALHIRKLAKEMGIPMVENRPLARALHAEVPVGNVIPEELYGPVAKVLAIVFKKRARQRVRGVRNRQPVS